VTAARLDCLGGCLGGRAVAVEATDRNGLGREQVGGGASDAASGADNDD
jgi:hypothetical protein